MELYQFFGSQIVKHQAPFLDSPASTPGYPVAPGSLPDVGGPDQRLRDGSHAAAAPQNCKAGWTLGTAQGDRVGWGPWIIPWENPRNGSLGVPLF